MLHRLNCKGSALVTVYIFLSVLITLGAGVAASTAHELAQTRRHSNAKKAFWVAEAGIEAIMQQLKSGTTYDDEDEISSSFLSGDANYSVLILKPEAEDIYTLTSTGQIEDAQGDIERKIQQVVEVKAPEWPSAFDYALFGNGGSMQVKENGTVTGSIFQYGDVEIKENSTVTEYVYATGNISSKSSSDFEEGELPDPMPTLPTLDTTVYFDPELTEAEDNGDSSLTTDSINLNDGDVYVNGDIQLNADGVISGSGTIVATGDISIMERSTVAEGVNIIAGGTLLLKEDTEVGSEFMLYSSTEVQIKENGTGHPSGIVITPGDVQIKEDGNYTGIIYAGGAVQIKENSTITGSIVAGGSQQDGIQIKEDSYITYDASLLPTNIPPGLGVSSSGEVILTVLSWEELTP